MTCLKCGNQSESDPCPICMKKMARRLNATGGGTQMYVPNWQDKIARLLFPRRHVDLPEPKRGLVMADGLYNAVTCELSVVDRIRLLFTGRLLVDVKTATEFRIGEHATNSTVCVLPWRFLERK